MNDKPTHLDLFSGIGGFSIAAEAAGFRTIGFSEIDAYASAVLRKHWPTVPNYGDVRTVPAVGCDLVTGGFPCQPFSCAGKRRGKDDDRFLWPAMLDVIRRCRPAWVLGENVPGIIGMELDRCLTDLEGIGFRTVPFVVPACAVDARHRRDRVWIVAYAGSDSNRGVRRAGNHLPDGAPAEAHHQEGNAGKHGVGQNCPILANPNVPGSSFAVCRKLRGIQRQTKQSERRQPSRGDATSWAAWPVEPELGRVAHGIPNRAHRLKALGNAIVPQVAEVFLKAIFQQIQTWEQPP